MITYKPLWETMKQKGITTYALINKYGISAATIDRLKNGGGITTAKIDDLCRILGCKVEDIIEYVQ
jgi:DNA-binding Xre family transcriptional regulator